MDLSNDPSNTQKPAASRTTIRDIAQRAGVSVATASRALSNTGRIGEKTRKRVQTIAKELNYQPNTVARALVQQRTYTLGLLTNDSYGRFTLPMLTGLSTELSERGISTFLCADEYSPERLRANLSAMEAKGVDGLVVTGKRIDRGLPEEFNTLEIPTVYVHAAAPEHAYRFISDDKGGARAAVEHLVRMGRRNIAYVSGPKEFLAARLRKEGWLQTLTAHGLEPNGDAMFGDWSEAHGFASARHLFQSDNRSKPDAIFCGNDQIARGVVDSLTLLGLNVPDDVAIVGFDNWDVFAKATRPPLTTVDLGLKKLGQIAGKTILDVIDKKPVEAGTTKVNCELIIRQSCGANT